MSPTSVNHYIIMSPTPSHNITFYKHRQTDRVYIAHKQIT